MTDLKTFINLISDWLDKSIDAANEIINDIQP